jgi:enediyne biosynthesis protein E4
VTRPQGQRDRLFRNRRDGTFEEVTDAAGIFGETHGHSATWWDFNHDGWPDLYVANDFSAPDQLYRNNRDGTFTEALARTVPHLPMFAMGADLGDVNNDGLIDFLVADMAPTTREKDHRTMIEFRQLLPDPPNSATPPQVVQNTLLLNTGLERCLEAAHLTGLAATDWTWSVRFEDLDNDGWLDVHVTNGMVRDFFDSDLRARVAQGPLAERIRAIRATRALDEQNLAFRNRGDLQFEDVSTAWGLAHTGVSFGAAFGDLDSDGDLDLVFVNYEGVPTVCRNDGADGHSMIVALRGTQSNRFGVGASVRIETAAGVRVRHLVVARGYMSGSEPALHFGLGDETQIRRLTVRWPSGTTQAFDNLPADRRYTITEPAKAAAERAPPMHDERDRPLFEEVSEVIGLILESKEGAIDELKDQPLLPFRQNRVGPGVAIGDLNGDGRDDVVLGGASGQPAQFGLRAPDGTFVPQAIAARGRAADAAPLLLEVNGDGHADLLFPKGGVALPADDPGFQPVVFLSRGDGRFRQAPEGVVPPFRGSVGPAVAADFDRDGWIDVFLGGRVVPGAYGSTPRSAVWLNRAGRFSDETPKLAPELVQVGMVGAALATDVDQDGWIDLLLALQWGGVQCWRNDLGRRFTNASQQFGFSRVGAGWWSALAAADFNGDGRLDYAAGNTGLNTVYRASVDEPVLLLRGVFESSGKPQLIEAMFDHGTLVPRRGRTSLVAAMPALGRRFPTFAAYAAADLETMLGAELLRAAVRLQVTELQSGVFLSEPGGEFRFVPLPRLAQIASIFGLVAGDFDGDGHADICAVQNSHAPVPETGRFDGGLGQFLRGNGEGGFFAVPARESGLVVPGDGKALAVLDAEEDGRPDLIATRNNQRALVFRNRASDAGDTFAVTLEGSPQNPHALGARIMAVMTDGTTQVAEIHAGGGYLSQSSATAYFGYRRDNPPREIQIAWPTGMSSTHPWSAAPSHLRFSAPGR